MKLEDLEIYNLSMSLSDNVWNLVINWDFFSKDALGKQWTRAIDSVSLNISEGFGRNTYKDQRNFYYFSRGSLYESFSCLNKAKNRKLIDDEEYDKMLYTHNLLGMKLNKFIKSVNVLISKDANQGSNNE